MPTAGGPDAADFEIRRPGHATLECALYLALDAKQAFEALCGSLSEDQVQAVIRDLADGLYRSQIGSGNEPPAIQTIRARDLFRRPESTARSTPPGSRSCPRTNSRRRMADAGSSDAESQRLWGGRFEEAPDALVQALHLINSDRPLAVPA